MTGMFVNAGEHLQSNVTLSSWAHLLRRSLCLYCKVGVRFWGGESSSTACRFHCLQGSTKADDLEQM